MRRLGCAIGLALTLGLTAAPTWGLEPGLALTQYLHRIWQTSPGLKSATIFSILQSSDGRLWLGTQSGLVRFDGVQFSPVEEAGGDLWINGMVEGPDHGLWLGTARSGLVRIQDQKATALTTAQGLASNTVYSLMNDGRGGIWACTAAGLSHWDGSQFTNYGTAQGLPAQVLRACAEGKDGRLYFAGDGAVVNILKDKTFSRLPLSSVPAFAAVYALLADDDGTLWIGTTHGLVRLKDGKEQRLTTADGLADNWVFCLGRSGDGGLWVGTRDGFSRLAHGEIQSFRKGEGLSQSTVYTLLEDREGSLWVGTKHGLNQFLDRRLTPLTESEGLPGNEAGPVLQDRQGNMWVGMLGTGLSRYDGKRFENLAADQKLSSNVVRALAEGGKAGELWVGSDGGLDKLVDSKVAERYTTNDELGANDIRCLLRDRGGRLWVGTGKGLSVDAGGGFAPVWETYPPLHAAVLAMFERADNSLVFATQGGGVYWHLGTEYGVIGQDAAPNSSPHNDVDAFYEDSQGWLWMGTLGSGLRLLRGDKIVSFGVTDGLFDDDIYAIVPDGQDRLWMACSKGIFWVNRGDLVKFADGKAKNFVSRPYSPTEGQRTIECQSGVQPAAWRASDGRIWFSTNHGLIVIDPEHLQWKLPQAKVEVEGVVVNGQERSVQEVGDLAPGIDNLEFRYTCLSYQVPLRITFRYRLGGFDRDWIDAGSRREAFYTNLPPGRYRFEVKALNVDGVWSEAAAVELKLKPHFYQRGWFIPVCVGLAAIVAGLGIRLRIQRIKQHMQAILTERSRIARELHDTLLQGFSGVTMEMQALASRLEGGQQRNTLEEIIHDAGDCMREARRSVAGLRASSQGRGSGLAAAIAQTARQLTEARDIRLKLKVEECDRPLGAEVEYNLLRIVQEAVANAVQHSQARQVEVALSCTAQGLKLTVRDDGVGFDQGDGGAPGAGHYGLIGMKERASQIGGKFELETSPGSGTAVRVELANGKTGE